MLVGDVVDALAGDGLASNGGTGNNVVALDLDINGQTGSGSTNNYLLGIDPYNTDTNWIYI